MLQTAAENNTAIIRLPSQCINTVVLVDKCFLGLERIISKTKTQLINHSISHGTLHWVFLD
jgi:hypothetical protein